jgi:nucleoid-associated protein YgaU
MGLDVSGKLEKLKIMAYTNKARSKEFATFTVMFNPTSLTTSYTNVYQIKQGINTMGAEAKYTFSRSPVVAFDIIIDGTGVTEMGLVSLLGDTPTVSEQIHTFLDLCFCLQGKNHQPYFLKIQWGQGELQDFDCRLISVDIEYTAFEINGAPLRATLKTMFKEDTDSEKLALEIWKRSPDLTHTRIVKQGDTLPLLSKAVYGSSRYYLRLAQANNLNNFRDLIPGVELLFPPLEK